MSETLGELPRDLRGEIAAAIRERQDDLVEDASAALAHEPGISPDAWHVVCEVLVSLLSVAVGDGGLDNGGGAIHDLTRFVPPLTARQAINAIHRVERIVLDDLAVHDRLGATSEPWPVVAHSLRCAMLEVITAFVESDRGRPALRDQLTTLLSPHVFGLALAQEAQRALRHEHGLAVILFDIDDLSQLNWPHARTARAIGLGAARHPRELASGRTTGSRATTRIRSPSSCPKRRSTRPPRSQTGSERWSSTAWCWWITRRMR
jgi:hypothetical protein